MLSLTPTFLTDWRLDYLEVVERSRRHSPPALSLPHPQEGTPGPVAAVQPGDPLPAPLLAVRVERLGAVPGLEDTGEGSRLGVLVLVLGHGEGEGLGELGLGEVGGRDAGAEFPGGGRSEITQTDLPGACRAAGQRQRVLPVSFSHHRHSEAGNIKAGPQLRGLLIEFSRATVNTRFLFNDWKFDLRPTPGPFVIAVTSGKLRRHAGPGRGQAPGLGDVPRGEEGVHLGVERSGNRNITHLKRQNC